MKRFSAKTAKTYLQIEFRTQIRTGKRRHIKRRYILQFFQSGQQYGGHNRAGDTESCSLIVNMS